MHSSITTHNVEINDEITKMNVYDDNGYLPIHRATFNGLEVIIKGILEDAEKHNELNSQLEATTHDIDEFTPLLLATAAGRLETIACFLEYPVNINVIDARGHDMAAIAALSQNERTFRYIIDHPIITNQYNAWKSLFKLIISIKDEESIICGRMLELLIRRELNSSSISPYWTPMLENGLLKTLIQLFSFTKNDDILLNTCILLFNVITEVPIIKSDFKTLDNPFSAILKHTRSKNDQILILIGRILYSLSTDKSLIDSMVEQGLMESLLKLITNQHSSQIICSYFDCLSNIISYSFLYQQKISNAKDFLLLLVNVYLEDFDLNLSLSVIRFIRHLVKNNESIQNVLAHYGVCEHLLGALTVSSKELQQASIEAIQALSYKNQQVQQILLRENAIEQLLNLLDKTNMSNLQIVIVCTLWTLCETSSTRKREVATKIGVRKLISFYMIKSDEHLLPITDALYELTQGAPTIKMNTQEEISRAQGIPYLIRLLKLNDEMLVLSVLKTLQLICCAPGFVANRTNQEIILNNDGIKLVVALTMHAKNEIVQVEAAQCLACIALTNNECSTVIENTLDFSYLHIIYLTQSTNTDVQLKASNALATFIYNNSHIQSHLSKHYQLSFDYFEKFLQTNDDYIRCTAAFQIVVLSNLIFEQKRSVNIAIGCGILIDLLRLSEIDKIKSLAAECLARLAHMKSGSEIHKHTGVPQSLIAVDAIDYLCNLFSSPNDITIGNASVALGFLTYIPEGRRKLLNRCRSEPDIMGFLKVYNCLASLPPRLSSYFIEDWERYHTLKLPKLRSRGSNIRYFRVISNSIERVRVAPSSSHDKEQTSSIATKFYTPSIRLKI
ncbi:unnamed protein product [Adineta steineri]|uniref:Uncharacterized protein n=2 Tax=Adineta steineri TaxID=433720 RepID=A0A815A579_9BILA|nr:unnamed protein product [Adineta steineri]CAF1484986.1 unnamed protein product [Adineta steineri]